MKDVTKILIVNGVNLKQLGTREINIYGSVVFEDYLQTLRARYPEVELSYAQSDSVDELAAIINQAVDYDGIVLNAGAYTHTSVVLADAVGTIAVPVVEVHISNLFGREQYRRNSCLSAVCAGFISGFGLDGYRLAVEAILEKIKACAIKPRT